MEMSESLEKRREQAQYHFLLAVDSVQPSGKRNEGGFETCRLAGRVIEFRRHPGIVERVVGGEEFALDTGERVEAAILCSPPGESDSATPRRIVYGGPDQPRRLEVWGSFIDGEFRIADFRQA